MTKQEKILAIEKKVREKLPELMEASFGCLIHVPQNGGGVYCYCVVDNLKSNNYQDLAPITYKGNQIHQAVIEIVLARDCAITDDTLDRFAVKDIIIIGHPVHPHHLLQVLGEGWALAYDGSILADFHGLEEYTHASIANLRIEPNWRYSNDETIDFLYEQICILAI